MAHQGSAHAAPLFALSGKITSPSETIVSMSDLDRISHVEMDTVVDTLAEGLHHVKGVLGRDLLRLYGASGTNLRVIGLDGYTIDVPVRDLQQYDVVLATEIDGKRLTVRDKGPTWLIYPVSQHPELTDPIYTARAVWQIARIEVN